MDGFGSLPLNLSSVPFTGRFEPGCRTEKKSQYIMLLSIEIYMLMRGKMNLGREACENTVVGAHFGTCRSLLTARSSSSELNRLSRSLMDTTKSVSWMRLVEAILL